ncbi:hypothetical protein EYZ11_010309 [Aspergillus tanneri]|uniref:Uncharacterized protein n=1 Tax=Aspergillus tanneri TaxID=1220188 RepID=A0A4S3J7T3_9EURO|nr:hypothetical protein EYZ11_010309 [Aspergillus tanneri]
MLRAITALSSSLSFDPGIGETRNQETRWMDSDNLVVP